MYVMSPTHATFGAAAFEFTCEHVAGDGKRRVRLRRHAKATLRPQIPLFHESHDALVGLLPYVRRLCAWMATTLSPRILSRVARAASASCAKPARDNTERAAKHCDGNCVPAPMNAKSFSSFPLAKKAAACADLAPHLENAILFVAAARLRVKTLRVASIAGVRRVVETNPLLQRVGVHAELLRDHLGTFARSSRLTRELHRFGSELVGIFSFST